MKALRDSLATSYFDTTPVPCSWCHEPATLVRHAFTWQPGCKMKFVCKDCDDKLTDSVARVFGKKADAS